MSESLHRTGHSQNLVERHIMSLWSVIIACLQARSPSHFPTATLLLPLTPLLVFTLLSKCPRLFEATLVFWAATFDRDEGLSYPRRLTEAFLKLFETTPPPQGLRLAGLGPVGVFSRSPGELVLIEESVKESNSSFHNLTKSHSDTKEMVVLPNHSPSKCLSPGLRYGRRKLHPSPHKKPHPFPYSTMHNCRKRACQVQRLLHLEEDKPAVSD